MRFALTAFLFACMTPVAVSAQIYGDTQHPKQPRQDTPTLGSFATGQNPSTGGIVYQQDITHDMPAAPHAVESQTSIEEYYAPAPVPTFDIMKYAVLQTLDKVTARTTTVTLQVGKPHAVGPIFVDVKSCQKTPPTEQPEAAAFIQVWEAKPKIHGKHVEKQESQWVFSGWMFASSPALSAMNHPIYDVWVKDCVNEATPATAAKKTANNDDSTEDGAPE